MKLKIKLLALLIIIFASTTYAKTYKVKTIAELNNSMKSVLPGDCIEMVNGTWTDVQMVFRGIGTDKKHIVIKAQTPGKVIINGASNLSISGKYIDVQGLVFKNGYTPTKAVILFKTSDNEYAYHCSIYNCVIDNYNQPIRETEDNWVSLWGKNNRVAYCYFGGKTNLGTTVIVCPNDKNSIENNHMINNNYFGPRLRLGSNMGETLRIGTSEVCTNSSQTKVWNNYFDHCNGEVEIISVKSCDNDISNNTFFECEGSLVLRHGNRNNVKGNWFIGNDKPFTGGIRIINEGHVITKNYFYKLRGDEFRSPLTVMNGIPNSPASGYAPVRDVLFANNTFNDCALPWNFCVGVSERNRIVAPQNIWVVNNLVYNPNENEVIKSFDTTEGFKFANNLLISKNGVLTGKGDISGTIKESCNKDLKAIYTSTKPAGNSIDKLEKVNTLLIKPFVGAFQKNIFSSNKMPATKNDCGPVWYKPENSSIKINQNGKSIIVKAGIDNLSDAVNKANNGDILLLTEGTHIVSKKISVNKYLTICPVADLKAKPVIKMQTSGQEESLFEIQSDGNLKISGIIIDGKSSGTSPKFAFISANQAVRYSLFIDNCEISGFSSKDAAVFSSLYCTMADTIKFSNSKITNCYSGINLHKEKEDGKYNAETVILYNSVFANIDSFALDYYRGGNDESTVGGSLEVNHCVFDAVGNTAGNAILSLNRIMYVKIKNSVFSNSKASSSVNLWYLYNNISNSCFFNCAKPEFSKGATSKSLIFENPGFKGKGYELSANSILKGIASDGKNIGIQ